MQTRAGFLIQPLLRQWKITVLLLMTVVASGCSSIPEDDFKNRFHQATNHFGQEFEFFYIPSYGWIADREFVKLTPLGDPSLDARQLARMLAFGEYQPTKIAVYCPSSERMASVLHNALYLNKHLQLPELEILFIGEQGVSTSLQQRIESLGGHYTFQNVE
jgi:hypothetical protein